MSEYKYVKCTHEHPLILLMGKNVSDVSSQSLCNARMHATANITQEMIPYPMNAFFKTTVVPTELKSRRRFKQTFSSNGTTAEETIDVCQSQLRVAMITHGDFKPFSWLRKCIYVYH